LLATAGWSLECTGFWLVANAFVPGSPITFAFATYTFALSAVAGAVLILFPGGLGVTEGVMTTLLATRYRALALTPETARASAGRNDPHPPRDSLVRRAGRLRALFLFRRVGAKRRSRVFVFVFWRVGVLHSPGSHHFPWAGSVRSCIFTPP
jgi:uncharacterized membrane protein YbhN (UPF0104 family)